MIQRQTTSDALVDGLIRHGVDTVFGIPGVQTYGLFDALHRASDRIRVLHPRHEQATGYMAYGYSKSSGRPGVFSVVPGPGVLNAGAALCTAYGASTPVLCLTGQIPAAYIGQGMGHLHELPDQLATLRSLVKWAGRVSHPTEAGAAVNEAFQHMLGGRPRPVALEVPWDVFTQTAPRATLPPAPIPPAPEPDADLIDRAVALLADARRPMIMAGGGAQHAAAEIRLLAQRLEAPVVAWRGGRGVVSDDDDYGFNCAAGYGLWADTDLLIGIGSRLELQWFRWAASAHKPRLVCIDVDPEQMTRLHPDVGLVTDAAAGARALLDAVNRRLPVRASRREEFRQVKADVARQTRRIQPHTDFLEAIRDVLPRDGIFVDEICQAGFASHFAFPIYAPRTFISSGHQGTLGYGYSTALGVQVANPGRAVVSISGDGGFLFGVQELATAVQHRLPVVSVVFNNGAFGNVLRDQQQQFSGRVIGAQLSNPDFVKLAESFGMPGWRVTDPPALRRALEAAFGSGGPALIEVVVEMASEVSPWEFLLPGMRPSPAK